MKAIYLDFEKSIAEFDLQIEQLHNTHNEGKLDLKAEIQTLEKKRDALIKEVYADLNAWQTSQVARHARRPYTLDIINHIFTDFEELHGDRSFADDPSIVGGLAKLGDISCVVIGHQKGRDLKERTYRNFGMPRPEGYRKALRLMKLAERFGLPILTFIDTPGAYPGIGAEERGQSEAIGHNLYAMAELKTPIIATVIGEGGSGGALAIAVADQVLMLQYSIYSVISPEGCASILWKSAERANEASEALGLTAKRLKAFNLIDDIIEEPLGGAHRQPEQSCDNIKKMLNKKLTALLKQPTDTLVAQRFEKIMAYGLFDETHPAVTN